jgi:hypothetical protein
MSNLDHEFERKIRGWDTEAYKTTCAIFKYMISNGKYANLALKAKFSLQQAMHRK